MIKNLLKSKKGVAIESSILFLLVTFLMCTLISVYSASVRKNANGFKEELTEKYIELDERVTRHTEQIKTCFNQISDLKTLVESMKDLVVAVQLMARDQKDIGKKVDGLAKDLAEIKEKPSKRWDTVVTVAITVVVTAIVTLVLTNVGLK